MDFNEDLVRGIRFVIMDIEWEENAQSFHISEGNGPVMDPI